METGMECGAGHGKDCGVDPRLQEQRRYVWDYVQADWGVCGGKYEKVIYAG